MEFFKVKFQLTPNEDFDSIKDWKSSKEPQKTIITQKIK